MSGRIVVVDDCSFMLKIAEDVINDLGYTAATARNSIEANSHIFQQPLPFLIIIDVEMPMLSGDKTTHRLKSVELLRQVPVLLMSSKTDQEMQSLCDLSGADGYLVKPLTREKLITAIHRHCTPRN